MLLTKRQKELMHIVIITTFHQISVIVRYQGCGRGWGEPPKIAEVRYLRNNFGTGLYSLWVVSGRSSLQMKIKTMIRPFEL